MTGIGEYRVGQGVRQERNITIELIKQKTISRYALNDSMRSRCVLGKDLQISILHVCYFR